MNPKILHTFFGILVLFALSVRAQESPCKKLKIGLKSTSTRLVIQKGLKQLESLSYLNPYKAQELCECLTELSATNNASAKEKIQILYWSTFLKFYIKPYSAYQERLFSDLEECAHVFQKNNDAVGQARSYRLLAQLYNYQIIPDTNQSGSRIDSARYYLKLASETINFIQGDQKIKAILKGEVFNEEAAVLIRSSKDSSLARIRLDSSLHYFKKAAYWPGIARAYLNMTYVSKKNEGLRHWNKALKIFTRLGYQRDIAYCHLVMLHYAWTQYEKYNDDSWFFQVRKGGDAFLAFKSLQMRPKILGLAHALNSKLFIIKAKRSNDAKYRAYYVESAKEECEEGLKYSKEEGDWYTYNFIVHELASICQNFGDCSEQLRAISNDYYSAIDKIKKDASEAERLSQGYIQTELASKARRKTQLLLGTFSLLVLILGSGFYTFRLRDKLLIEKERNAGLEAREATRKARLNTHFISNVVNNIQFLIDLQEYPVAKRSLLQFEGYFRSVLSFTESTHVSLEKDKTLIEQFIALAKLGYEEAIQFEGIKVENSEWPIAEVYVPPLLAQPDIENAIKHGILKKPSRKGHLDVSIRPFDEKRLEYLITDDGIGVENTLKMRSPSQEGLDQKGGKIVEDALYILNKRNQVPEGQEHEHPLGAFRKVSSNHQGTRVCIIFPYQTNAHGKK